MRNIDFPHLLIVQLMDTVAHQINCQLNAWLLSRESDKALLVSPSFGVVGAIAVGFSSSFPWQPSLPYVWHTLCHGIKNSQIVGEYLKDYDYLPTLEGVDYTEKLVAANTIELAITRLSALWSCTLKASMVSWPLQVRILHLSRILKSTKIRFRDARCRKDPQRRDCYAVARHRVWFHKHYIWPKQFLF